jgi:hypothetical protein
MALEAAAKNLAVPARSGQIRERVGTRSVVVRLLADGSSVMDLTASVAGDRFEGPVIVRTFVLRPPLDAQAGRREAEKECRHRRIYR